jgi:hypothetical protein
MLDGLLGNLFGGSGGGSSDATKRSETGGGPSGGDSRQLQQEINQHLAELQGARQEINKRTRERDEARRQLQMAGSQSGGAAGAQGGRPDQSNTQEVERRLRESEQLCRQLEQETQTLKNRLREQVDLLEQAQRTIDKQSQSQSGINEGGGLNGIGLGAGRLSQPQLETGTGSAAEIQKIKSELSQERSRYFDLEKMLDRSDVKVKDLESEIARFARDKETAIERERQIARQDRDSLVRQVERMEQDVKDMTSNEQSLLDQLNEARRGQTTRGNQANAEVLELERSLSQVRSEMTQQRQEHERELRDKMSDITRLSSDIAALEDEMDLQRDRYEQRIRELQQQGGGNAGASMDNDAGYARGRDSPVSDRSNNGYNPAGNLQPITTNDLTNDRRGAITDPYAPATDSMSERRDSPYASPYVAVDRTFEEKPRATLPKTSLNPTSGPQSTPPRQSTSPVANAQFKSTSAVTPRTTSPYAPADNALNGNDMDIYGGGRRAAPGFSDISNSFSAQERQGGNRGNNNNSASSVSFYESSPQSAPPLNGVNEPDLIGRSQSALDQAKARGYYEPSSSGRDRQDGDGRDDLARLNDEEWFKPARYRSTSASDFQATPQRAYSTASSASEFVTNDDSGWVNPNGSRAQPVERVPVSGNGGTGSNNDNTNSNDGGGYARGRGSNSSNNNDGYARGRGSNNNPPNGNNFR